MGTLLDKIREGTGQLDDFTAAVNNAAAAVQALIAIDPRIEPRRTSPAGGGGDRTPFVRADATGAPGDVRIATVPAPTTPRGPLALGPAPPASESTAGGGRLAVDYARLGLPGAPNTLWTDPRNGKQYILGPYGLPNWNAGPLRQLPYSTSSSGGPSPSGPPSEGGGGVLPPGFVQGGPHGPVPAPIPPPGNNIKGADSSAPVVRAVQGVERAVSRTSGAVAVKLDKLASAIRDAGRFSLRGPI